MKIPFVYSQDLRALEQSAVDNGMSYETLMECAGTSVARHLINNNIVVGDTTVLVLCGKGNNGGDGYVIARHLAAVIPSTAITVIAVDGEPVTALARGMKDRLLNETDIKVTSEYNGQSTDVVIDAVYGIGFRGVLPDKIAELFDNIRSNQSYTVAVDIPSGIHADSSGFDKRILSADITITFTSRKRSMCFDNVCKQCGTIVVKSVGIPNELVAKYEIDTSTICIVDRSEDDFKNLLPIRIQHSHKGTFGQVHAFCGSYGMAGAAMLCGEASLRCGVGLLHYYVPSSIYPIVACRVPEAVYHPLSEDVNGVTDDALAYLSQLLLSLNTGAMVCGPGLSGRQPIGACLRNILPNITLPIVLDADGINAYIGHIDELKAISVCVLTPHPAEAARLLGCTVHDIEEDRALSAHLLAKKTGAVVVLKGHHTIVADSCGMQFVNVTGCSGLAKGGSGDVLAGMIAAFLAQQLQPYDAACLAVYLHGAVSLMTARRLSETGMLPRDLLDDLPKLLSEFEKRG